MAAKVLTEREKEIRDAERKALAEVRRWRRMASQRLAKMTPEEVTEYYRKQAEELRARGYHVGSLTP